MATLGTLIGGAIGGFGRKPVVPSLPLLDPGQIQRQTISDNLFALPDAQRLAGSVNKFNFDQIRSMLESFMPGFGESLGRAQSFADSLLRGQIPQDVSDRVQTSAAARALGGGFAGSGFARNLVARDLGLTSLDLMGQGASTLGALGQFAGGLIPQFDFSSAFLSPGQRLAFESQQQENQFNRNFLAEKIRAQPDPFKAALTQAIIEDERQIMELIGSVAGMAGGAMCWVAREVYGDKNLKWVLFRHWLLRMAPRWFLAAYVKFGRHVAAMIRPFPSVKSIIAKWMDSKIKDAMYANIN